MVIKRPGGTTTSSMLDQSFYFQTSLLFRTSGTNIILFTILRHICTCESLIPDNERGILILIMVVSIVSLSQSRNISSSMLDQSFYFQTSLLFRTSGTNIILFTILRHICTCESLIPDNERGILILIMVVSIVSLSQSRNISSSMLDQSF